MSTDLITDDDAAAIALSDAEHACCVRHASAHALVAHLFGWSEGGECTPPEDAGAGDEGDSLWQGLCYSLAGLLGEGPADPLLNRERVTIGDQNRVGACASWIVRFGPRPAQYDGPMTVNDLVAAATAHTTDLLAKHAGALDALTEAWMQRNWLRAVQVAAIVAAVSEATE